MDRKTTGQRALTHVLSMVAGGLLFGAIASGVQAQEPAAAKADQAQQKIEGEIRIWGTPEDGKLIEAWEAGFSALHPGIRFSTKLTGPESTMAGVYTDVADLALMGREMRMPVDSMAFEWVHRYKATSIEVANAGVRAERPNTTVGVFVHADNPLGEISLAGLDAVIGGEHKRGTANARTWGDLGLTGAWKDRPVTIYGPKLDSASALFVRHAVLKDSRKWNPAYREVTGAGQDILAALAKDPAGIAFTGAGVTQGGVKLLRLSAEAGGASYAPTAENVAGRTYPLARVVTVVLNRPPDQPVAPRVREFLAYVLSREGQDAIVRDGIHIPLDPETVKSQLKRLQ